MNIPSVPDLISEALRLSTRLESVTDEQYRIARRLAEVTEEFERVEARTWIAVRSELGPWDEHDEKRLKKDYESEVTGRLGDLPGRKFALEAELKALENASRNLRQQLSVLQTTANAVKAELELAGKGPDERVPA